MVERDEDGRPVESSAYFAELLAAGMSGLSYEELERERRENKEKGQ